MKHHVAVTVCLGLCSLLLFISCNSVAARTHAVSSQKFPDFKGVKDWCISQKTALDCDLRSDCVWCVRPSSKVGTGCYPVSTAKLIPDSWGIVCDKELEGQQQAVQQSACDGKPEASCAAPQCVWCTSAAVGGGCYTPEEAKKLPGAIFKCKTAPSVFATA